MIINFKVFPVLLVLANNYINAADISRNSRITKYDNSITDNGYKFSFTSDDGSSRNEQGVIKNQGTKDELLVVSGEYNYIGDDGITYLVKYVADENGFRPEGPHIPKLLSDASKQNNEEEEFDDDFEIETRFQPGVLASLVG